MTISKQGCIQMQLTQALCVCVEGWGGERLEPSQADSGAWHWRWLLVTGTTKWEAGVFMLHPDLTQWARGERGQVIPKL